ncbi:MAG: MBL fold metallo-hydrolase [Oscillospiraceae bacterium]|nr:MBL fold metallo-hydrolase [Oscillospiraceae bacterium]
MNVTRVRPNVWHIEESYRVYCTLVTGRSRAVLWDTGTGRKNLRERVREITSLPCLVLCSHGHADHTGGNALFDAAALSREDWPLLTPPQPPTRDLRAGERLDLDGEQAAAVPLAGHTRGSMGLLLERERLLLSGDALGPNLMLAEDGLSPAETLRSLSAAARLPFDEYLASHAPLPQPRAQLDFLLRHLANLPDPAAAPCRGGELTRSTMTDGKRRSVILYKTE